MPKETSDATKPKVTRTRRKRVEESEFISVGETAPEAVSKPRRRVVKPKTTKKVEVTETPVEVDNGEVTSVPVRKAPTIIKDEASNTRSGIKVSRHWYAMALLALAAFGGAAYIGYQDSGAIDVDTLMAERRRALNEERSARSIPVQNQVAAVSALDGEEVTDTASSSEDVVSPDGIEAEETNSTTTQLTGEVEVTADREIPIETEGLMTEVDEIIAD